MSAKPLLPKSATERPSFPARLPVATDLAVAMAAPVVTAAVQPPQTQARAGLRGAEAARHLMVQRLQRLHGIVQPQVLAAMQAVERHHFVDSALRGQAYEDTSLPIGFEQTISKPQVVAKMLQLLLERPLPAQAKALEIGTGCGYQAAVLAQLFSKVYSIERIKGLHHKAHDNLLAQTLQQSPTSGEIHLIFGDGMAGYAAGGPYHAIISAAGGQNMPPAWLAQLAPGGRLVAPIEQGHGQALVVIDKTADGRMQQQVLDAVHFVPLKSGSQI